MAKHLGLRLWRSCILLVLLVNGALIFSEEECSVYCSEDYYYSTGTYYPGPVTAMDADILNFALNLEYLEAEYFIGALYREGLDKFAPNLSGGGPPPIGLELANIDPATRDIVQQFALQEIGHLRIIRETVTEAIPRPLLDYGVEVWAKFFEEAFGYHLTPPFNPYANSVNFVLSVYFLPYMGLTAYVGANPNLTTPTAKRLVAGLLGVESGQDAVTRHWLYERSYEKVYPYPITVAEMTAKISVLRNNLGKTGIVDEGVIVPKDLGAEGRISGNILSADPNSLSYSRTPGEVLRVLYDTGNESIAGGFYPQGANGRIAGSYLLPPHPG